MPVLEQEHVRILGWLSLVLALLTSLHVVLYKRNVRSATAWIVLIWLSPLLGPLLYPLFGINRVRRRAMALRPRSSRSVELPVLSPAEGKSVESEFLEFGRRVTGRSAVGGNHIFPHWGGDEAYPAMLNAIASAEQTVCLSSYIFDRDSVGLRFVDALEAAAARGVEVRVLLDDVGAHYSFFPIDWTLRKKGIRTARFLKIFNMRSIHLVNLRLHRKLLITDGKLAFTGGMNIRQGHVLSSNSRRGIRDVHFCVQGPVVRDLQEVFAEDWGYSTGESLAGEKFFPELLPFGKMICRSVVDGPDSHIDTVRLLLQGAVASARHSLLIVTPYFIPDSILTAALNVAALRGVRVQVVVPENNNLPWCHWAMQAGLPELVRHGCEIYYAPGDFDHSKLFVVDDRWVLFGSSNWDERSLRLNFELNMECYDADLAKSIGARVRERILLSRRIDARALESLPLPVRVRDGIARLFGPNL